MWLHLIALGWLYVTLMMALAELLSPVGSWLGALFTLVGYGLLPLGLLLYILGTPLRKRRRQRLEAEAESAEAAARPPAPDDGVTAPSASQRDERRHAAGDTLPPERKEV